MSVNIQRMLIFHTTVQKNNLTGLETQRDSETILLLIFLLQKKKRKNLFTPVCISKLSEAVIKIL